ncbi:MAG: reverse transcriptase family protein [Thiohalocapsa sp.]|nr:reverse transcriptase family protein [Thiohalocapsa sp.]MCF7990909.1 reverse transcriptase family protein [Thiohalocapsa sp.]
MSDTTEPKEPAALTLAALIDRDEQSAAGDEQRKIDSRRDLARYIGIPLRHLADVLYEADRSRFYTVKTIPKASGGTRTLHAVSGKLKDVQRKALDKLQRKFPPSDRAHGFVPGRSIITNAIPHRRKKLVVKLDIVDFFPSIRVARVFGMFQAPPFRFGREAAMTLAQLACVPEHNGPLPQGGVLSPYVANVICRRMDQRLASIARQHRCNFTRYADDLTFSTNDANRLDADRLIAKVREVVEGEGFAINDAKTRVLRQSDRQIVTGIVVNDGLNVTRRYLRSLRAILHNMEKEGIEAQLIKGSGLKDRRASRLELVPDGDGYRLGNHKLTKEQAVERFLQHLVGRFAFVGQVVNAEGQDNQQIRYRRVVLYKRLLNRFRRSVRSAVHAGLGDGPKHCERAIRSLMERYASVEQESEWYRRAKERRESELERWRESKEGRRISAALARTTNASELCRFVQKEAKSDVRYWPVNCGDNPEALRVRVEENARYPSLNRGTTRQVVNGFKDTSDLGGLTHRGDATPASLLQILLDRYEPHYYELPNALRKLVDPMSAALRDIVLQDGEDVSLDLFKDPRLDRHVKQLKEGTRLIAPGSKKDEGKPITELLTDAYEKGLERAEKKPGTSVPWKDRFISPHQAIYTVVPALWISLVDIFHSIGIHSEHREIEVETYITEQGCFQIRISDANSSGLEIPPARDFAHGKIRHAAFELFAIAGYWIFTRFEDGAVHRVDMLTGKTARATDARYPGFTHLIVLPNEKGFIEEPSVGDAATGSDSAATPRRTVRVLIIDNNEQRRNDNVQCWSSLPDVELDAVAQIDRESYRCRELDLVLVHESNPESEWIHQDVEDRWPVVFFSGNNTLDCEVHEGRWFVSPVFLREHFGKLVDKIVHEGGKDCVGLS